MHFYLSLYRQKIYFLLIFILYQKKIFTFLDKCCYLFLTYSLFMFFCSLGNSLYLFFDCSFNLSLLFLRSILWLVLIIFLYFFDNRYSFLHILRQKKKKLKQSTFFIKIRVFHYSYGIIFAHIPKLNSAITFYK